MKNSTLPLISLPLLCVANGVWSNSASKALEEVTVWGQSAPVSASDFMTPSQLLTPDQLVSINAATTEDLMTSRLIFQAGSLRAKGSVTEPAHQTKAIVDRYDDNVLCARQTRSIVGLGGTHSVATTVYPIHDRQLRIASKRFAR